MDSEIDFSVTYCSETTMDLKVDDGVTYCSQ